MKKILFLSVVLFVAASQLFAAHKGYDVQIIQQRSDQFTIQFNLGRYQVQKVQKDGLTYSDISSANPVNLKKQGWAEMPFVSIPVQLSPDRNVDIEILNVEYVDIDLDFPMIPSRGVIYRNQNPDEIPYLTDPASIVNEWYPANLSETGDPFIIRKVRGQNITVYPFRYNAVTQKLRVCTNMSIQVTENHDAPVNKLPENLGNVNREMSPIYNSLFVNYNQNQTRWAEEIGEFGDVLVIYTSRDATAIQPWIDWKQQKGYNVDELQVSTGTNVASDIQSAYNANNNLLYVLLVGDWADVKSDLGPDSAPTDPMMGCVVGTDDHHDIIIGRFSAESTADVTAQVNKTIEYEKDAAVGDTWYKNALGIASSEGTGDDGEYDYDQIDNIHDDRLLPSTYTTCHEVYDPGASASSVQSHINAGVSVINYCGHGGHDYWVSSSYSASNASSSSNTGMYYYAFSVACIVGEFHNGGDCLAEGMMRKANAGAVATWMSTINQPWQPPMRGQDYANDLLIQGFDYSAVSAGGTSTSYGRTTFGAITFNAAELMVAESGGNDDWETYETWTIFGDPSVQVRTDEPSAISLTNMSVTPGTYTTQVQVGGSAFEGAIVSLWQSGSQPVSAVTDASGNVSIDHSFTGTVKLTVTGFNLETYHADHVIAVPDPPVCDFSADQTVITAGQSIQFTDISTNYPSTWNWTLTGGTPSSSNEQNPLVVYNTPGTYDVTLYVQNTAGNDSETKTTYITVNPITEVPVSDFNSDVTSVNIGGIVNFSDLSTNQPDSWSWTFEGGTPASSSDQNPSVTYNTPGTYIVELSAGNSVGAGNTETKVDYITVVLPEYCDADVVNEIEYISNFTCGSLNNSTNWTSYGDYTSMYVEIAQGNAENFSLSIADVYSADEVTIYADWNRDGDFDDANEIAWESSSNGQASYSGSIAVPPGTSVGPVRLRVRLNDSSSGTMSPCGSTFYGEVEDYTINVISLDEPPTCATNPLPLDAAVNINPSIATISWAGNSADNFDVYFGTDLDPLLNTPVNVTTSEYTVNLDENTTYYWTIVSHNDYGNASGCDVWSFTTSATQLIMSDGSVTTCSGLFMDSGADGDYGNDESYTYTIYPATPGAMIEVEFTSLNIEPNGADCYDDLAIYDGEDATGTQFGVFCGTDNGVIGDNGVITATNTAGALTFVFNSDMSETRAGWTANVSCVGGTTYELTFNVTDGTDPVQGAIISLSGYGTQTTDVSGQAIFAAVAEESDIVYSVTADCFDAVDGTVSVIEDQIENVTMSMVTYDATIASVDPMCSDATTITLSATDAGGVWSGTGVSGDQFDPATAGEGDHLVTYTIGTGVCQTSDTETIHVDAEVDATINAVGPFCSSDVSVTLSAATAGGTWSGTGVSGDQFDPAIAGVGTHTITYDVTNGVCTDSDQIDIQVVDNFDATIDAVNPLCENDLPVTLTAVNAGGVWSGTGVSGDQFDPSAAGAGDHTVTYTVGTGVCADTDTEVVHVDAMPIVSIVPVDPMCEEDAIITLSADVADGTWSGTGVSGDQFNPATAGVGTHVISYTVSNGTCSETVQISIVVGGEPVVNVTTVLASSATIADGSASADVSGGLSPYEYEWSNADADETMGNVLPGTYSLTVTDAAGCQTIVEDILIDFTNSIVDETFEYAIYPNPAESEAFIKVENMIVERIELSNVLGQVVISIQPETDLTRINLDSFESGVYLIHIYTSKEQFTDKLIID